MIEIPLKQFPAKYKKEIEEFVNKFKINNFYYFTLIENVEAIINKGICSYNEIARKKTLSSSFANMDVQERRARRIVCNDSKEKIQLTVHDFVPVYLTPFTPTLYEVCNRQDISRKKIVFLIISTKILFNDNVLYFSADGNVAADMTNIYLYLDGLQHIDWEVMRSKYWNKSDDGKRKRNAEILFFPLIHPKYIENIVFLDRMGLMSFRASHLQLKTQINIEADPKFLLEWLPN